MGIPGITTNSNVSSQTIQNPNTSKTKGTGFVFAKGLLAGTLATKTESKTTESLQSVFKEFGESLGTFKGKLAKWAGESGLSEIVVQRGVKFTDPELKTTSQGTIFHFMGGEGKSQVTGTMFLADDPKATLKSGKPKLGIPTSRPKETAPKQEVSESKPKTGKTPTTTTETKVSTQKKTGGSIYAEVPFEMPTRKAIRNFLDGFKIKKEIVPNPNGHKDEVYHLNEDMIFAKPGMNNGKPGYFLLVQYRRPKGQGESEVVKKFFVSEDNKLTRFTDNPNYKKEMQGAWGDHNSKTFSNIKEQEKAQKQALVETTKMVEQAKVALGELNQDDQKRLKELLPAFNKVSFTNASAKIDGPVQHEKLKTALGQLESVNDVKIWALDSLKFVEKMGETIVVNLDSEKFSALLDTYAKLGANYAEKMGSALSKVLVENRFNPEVTNKLVGHLVSFSETGSNMQSELIVKTSLKNLIGSNLETVSQAYEKMKLRLAK